MDRDKVIKGSDICLNRFHCGTECPYYDNSGCQEQLRDDALALLKEKESEAKWIYGENKTGVDGWHCSECDFFEPWFYEFTDDIDFIRFYEYCPRCGRKMTSYTGKPTKNGR
jgi:hypothetical protein